VSCESPSDDAGTIVYLVLSHQNPRQVMRLVRALESGDPIGHVIVQHDDAFCSLEPGEYAAHPRVHFLAPPSTRRWGRYSLLEGLLDAFDWAVANLDFSWLVVLSGQDYPLQALSSFRARLVGAPYDAFVSARPVPHARPSRQDSGAVYMHARYYYRWYELPAWVLGWTRRSARLSRIAHAIKRRFSFAQPLIFVWSLPRAAGEMVGIRRLRVPFNDRLQCYTGLEWVTLSRHAVEAIGLFVQERTDVMNFYRRALIPSESLQVTIVCNSPELNVHMANHHYFRMTGGGQAHAAFLGRDDLDQALASGKPFARKFDERADPLVLDVLDSRIESQPVSQG
jgi:hypothetical protein